MMHIKKLLTHYFKNFFFFVRIQGESMWPALISGESYAASNMLSIRVHDYIIFRNPRDSAAFYVKRVRHILGSHYFAESLVSWGSSSDAFGLVPRKNIIGKIIWPKK